MKNLFRFALVCALAITLGHGFAFADNGAPDAKKVFSLNIIGVSKDKSSDMDNNSGHRIFVPLDDKAKIELIEGPDFAVLDADGTDGPAQLQLPNPGLDPYVVGDKGSADTMSDYSVYVRPLGKPYGWATITTCAQLLDSTFAGLLPGNYIRTVNRTCEWDSAYASVEQVGSEITFRDKGPSKFQNVTAELLTIVFEVETDAGTVYVRVPIFDPILAGEYWEYDNNGLKVLQVRFYENSTDVSSKDGDLPPLQ
jgi:hypothetical protein